MHTFYLFAPAIAIFIFLLVGLAFHTVLAKLFGATLSYLVLLVLAGAGFTVMGVRGDIHFLLAIGGGMVGFAMAIGTALLVRAVKEG